MFLSYGQASQADRPVQSVAAPATTATAAGPSTYAETSPTDLSLPKAGPVGTSSQSPQTSTRPGTPVLPSADGTLVLGEVYIKSFVPPPPPPKRPPDNPVHSGSQYLKTYRAARATWDDVIDRGRSLPGVSDRCANRWRNSGKDSRLNWKSVDFLCMDGLNGRAYKPQGIGGSATTSVTPSAQRRLLTGISC